MFRVPLLVSLLLISGSAFAQNTPSTSAQAPPVSAPHSKTDATEGNTAPQPAAPPDSQGLTLAKRVPVTYPAAAQSAGTQGYVVVKITTNANGDVENTSVVKGDPTLAAAVIDSLKQWKFQPFIKDGKPVNASANLEFKFEIVDDKCTNGAKQAIVTTPADHPITVPGKEMQAFICKKVSAVYPRMAELARVKGDVVMAATIGKDGMIYNIRVLSSASPLLNQSALEAVKQWRFHPYLVSGEPAEVATTISISFY